MFRYIFCIFLIVLGMLFSCTVRSPRNSMEVPDLSIHSFPRKPIPRIETGNHIGIISKISVDNENRYLVSGSTDKTVRVWKAGSDKPEKIIRPPLGEANEGMIYAVTIAPGGRTIACAGWTGLDWQSNSVIYIFDRDSGRMIQRVTGLPNVVYDLSYSKYGTYLAATFGGKSGICIYRTSDYTPVSMDTRYYDRCCGADFNINGYLATVAYDSFIRLYDQDFKLVTKVKGKGGEKPYSVHFSPDGMELAVGYSDSSKIDVFSGRDLAYIFSPDTTGINEGDLACVCWSAFGKSLYAGGQYKDEKGNYLIRKWKERGKGSYVNLIAANNTIQHIISLKDEGIAFSASGPILGSFDIYDQKRLFHESACSDYRDLDMHFLISNDASKIQFIYDKEGKHKATFSIGERLLAPVFQEDKNLVAPIVSTSEFTVSDWSHSANPKFNGKPISLLPYEISRCLSIAPDKSGFVLGTDQYLRFFHANGKELWKTATSGAVCSVNMSSEAKAILAAINDGSIRWYRLSDGKPFLSFFPHQDRKRWVLWSESGYFDASPGGDKIIGWHQNNGTGEAGDFFPISRIYYRPDVIKELIASKEEESACQIANQKSGRKTQELDIDRMIPPTITIVKPEPEIEASSAELVIQYRLQSPSGDPVTYVKTMIDGRPIQQRAIKIKEKTKDIESAKVLIPQRDCMISLIAGNKYSPSEPASIKVKWVGESFVIKPKLYVLAIGVSKYEDPNIMLEFAAKDATDFTEAVKRQEGLLYEKAIIKLLVDANAKKDNILEGFDWISKNTTANDVAMVFLAGHGVNDNSGFYYYLPVEANVDKILQTCVPFSIIKNTVSSLPGKAVFFVDTCHSGNVMGKRRGTVDITGIVNELSSAESGAVVFASSTGNQYSLEDPSWGNGAFTKALIEGIGGKADYLKKGKISVNMLDLYISERVKELTKGVQTPTTTKPETVPDFPLAIVGR